MQRFLLFLALLLCSPALAQAQNTRIKKVVFQGFWWDYKNDSFPNGWANYMTELAPRLKTMGVDAVWVPPTVKNQDFGEKGVGYAPYDNYDLGDKFQKNDATTRIGTKDDLLRMVAVLHANGIEVIQDIVPNHVIGAGSDTGGGGQDPAAPTANCTDKWKNFRYACFETPATDQSAAEYLSRKGRFPKNHQNFHPNPGNNCGAGLCDPDADPICWQGFGPDVSYANGAHGLSSNATYNPDQTTYSPYNNGGIGTNNGYMRKHTREWLIWYKKQMGYDGVRIDAVKHFESAASEDFLFNLQQSAGFANGTDSMFAVGEWVGDKTALDAWMNAVMNRSGTFDFGLRAFDASGGLRGMIYGNGGFDLGALPGAQQGTRYIDYAINGGTRVHRTVPFINNHDTYRPQVSANGNITGWNTGDELSPHVDIREPRLAAAYAIMCAMDGNPQVFFEDLLNVANTGKRFKHLPANTTDLPANQDIVNIMQAHGALDFKSGNYRVPSNECSFYNVKTNSNNNDDYSVTERSGKAIIGATDAWGAAGTNEEQEAWIDTDFPVGTVLMDYSGGIATTTTVLGPDPSCPGSGCPPPCRNRVNIKTKNVGWPSFTYSTTYDNHGAYYHGYSIWAPLGINLASYTNPAIPTVQEWEMENDLGDSHCSSLGQGGRTPDNSPNQRVVGKIFVKNGTTVNYTVTLGTPGTSLTFELYDLNGIRLHTVSGSTASLTGSFTNGSTRWITMKVRNTTANTTGQKCWVKMTYTAPASVVTKTNTAANKVSIWTSNGGSSDWNDCKNWEEGKIPTCSGTVIIPHAVKFMPAFDACFTGTFVNRAGLSLRPKANLQGPYNTSTSLMNDELRTASLVPTTSPYGAETTTAAVLAVTGNNAVVDWIKVEVRDGSTPATVLYARSALLQRDGDIVAADGVTPLFFNDANAGNYHVALLHRNHLPVMGASPFAMDTTIRVVNFADGSAGQYAGTARATLDSGVFGMIAGDADQNAVVSAADRSLCWNARNQSGYLLTDINLSGTVTAADRSMVWNNRNLSSILP
jgi:alpha-amylase